MTLFGDHPPSITRIVPTKGGLASVYAGRKRVATIPAKQADALGIAIGAPWTAELSDRAALALESLRARKKAVALLRVKARSRAELNARLVQSGFSPPAADAALHELAASGLVNDQALAQHAASRTLERGGSAQAAAARLQSRGLDHHAIQTALDAAARDHAGSELDRATQAARNRLAKLPVSTPATARHRRLLSALAALGYDEDTAREAVARVLGYIDE